MKNMSPEGQLEDFSHSLNDEYRGSSSAQNVINELNAHNLELPSNSVFLGLGCGSAKAELAFAQTMNSRTINLVDKFDRSKLVEKTSQRISFSRADMFDYLGKLRKRNHYDFITLFGVEYILENRSDFIALLKLVLPVLKKGGILYIFPSYGISKYIQLDQLGYINISPDPDLHLILVKMK